MHGKFATVAGAGFLVLVGAQSSNAEVIYPWCAQNSRGGRNCGFVTFEQCRATVSGTGFCVENPFYQRPADPVRRAPRVVLTRNSPPSQKSERGNQANDIVILLTYRWFDVSLSDTSL